jgi:hypothetical protein
MRPLVFRAAAALLGCGLGPALASPGRLTAQDSHYWADAYGTQARLLGGTVIGSNPDISAVYYNPGAVALADSLEFLISLNGLRYSQLSFSVPSVTKVPSNTGWSAVSNLVAGTIPIGGRQSRSRMAYSILTRQSFSFAAQLRAIPLDSFVPVPPPPPTTSLGNALANQSLSETWMGVTYATERDKRWGVGATMFVANRSQTFSQELSAQVVNGLGAAALAVREYDFSYYKWGVLFKLGAQYRAANWSAGLTVTTPRLGLFGGARVGATSSYVDEGVAGPGSSQIATSYQSNLDASYHSPLSVGAGIGRRWKTTAVSVAGEWFAAVPQFTIIPAQPFTPQTGGAAIPMALTAQYRSLVNWGIGVQHEFHPRLNAYAAFRSDQTAIPTGVKSVGTLVGWNLRHANFGVQTRLGKAAIILGVDAGWGSKDNVSAAGDPAPGLPALPTIDESYLNVTGAIGFKLTY